MDIVYLLKESNENDELRYSLRSLKNFPHDKVWFVGGHPAGFKPDGYIKVEQNRRTKWLNVRRSLEKICKNEDISEDFWIFNDDFFVMKRIKNPTNYYNGDLYKRIVMLEDHYKRITKYSQLLRNCCKELESLGCETKNYTLHVPILLNRKKLARLFEITDFEGFRSLYANMYKIGGETMGDVKITNLNKTYEDGPYVSTDDKSFNNGKVGIQIREKFKNKCKYEKEVNMPCGGKRKKKSRK